MAVSRRFRKGNTRANKKSRSNRRSTRRKGGAAASTSSAASAARTASAASATRAASGPSAARTASAASAARAASGPSAARAASGPSAARAASGPSGGSQVSLYFNLTGGSDKNAVRLVAHSPNAANLLGLNNLAADSSAVLTGNGIRYNQDKIKFPVSSSKIVNSFTCSSWLNNTWKSAGFLNAPTVTSAAFLLEKKSGTSYKTTPTTPLPATLDLNDTIVKNLWTGLNLATNSDAKRTNPPSGSVFVVPNGKANVKITFNI